MHWYLIALKNYVKFKGRSRRKEFWQFTLINFFIIYILLTIEGLTHKNELLIAFYFLGIQLPSLAVGVRRLHDTGRSGWWLLIGLVPIIGFIILLVFNCQDSQDSQDSQESDNQYVANPKVN